MIISVHQGESVLNLHIFQKHLRYYQHFMQQSSFDSCSSTETQPRPVGPHR